MSLNFGKFGRGLFPSSARQGLGTAENVYRKRWDVLVAQDGSGDCETIEEALAMMSTTGGTIYVSEGTYILRTLQFLKSNVSLIGSGWGTILYCRDGNTGEETGISAYGATNVLFKDLQILGNSATQNMMQGIYLENCSYWLFENVYFNQFDAAGAYLETDASHIIFNNCKFESPFANGYGVVGTGDWTRITNCTFKDTGIQLIRVTECVINNNTIYSGDLYGISLEGVEYSVISNNTITECSEHAIRLVIYPPGFISQKNIVSGNVISRNADTGIYLASSDYNVISNNSVMENGHEGINISNAASDQNVVSGNIALGNDNNYLDSGTGTVATGNITS